MCQNRIFIACILFEIWLWISKLYLQILVKVSATRAYVCLYDATRLYLVDTTLEPLIPHVIKFMQHGCIQKKHHCCTQVESKWVKFICATKS